MPTRAHVRKTMSLTRKRQRRSRLRVIDARVALVRRAARLRAQSATYARIGRAGLIRSARRTRNEVVVKVKVKQFAVDMEVKTNGIELEVRKPDDSAQIGDCYVTKTGLTWCKGKTTKPNGIRIT